MRGVKNGVKDAINEIMKEANLHEAVFGELRLEDLDDIARMILEKRKNNTDGKK